MHFKLVFLLTLLCNLASSQQPEIIDFTYTQLLEEGNFTGSAIEPIAIAPDSRQFEKYLFPEVCDLQEELQEGTASSGKVDQVTNLDSYLKTLQGKIMNLLKLAEEIKNSHSYLEGSDSIT